MRLLVVVPLTAADLPLAENLFKRLAELGPYEVNDLLVVADRILTPEQVNPLLSIVKSTFARGELIKTLIELPNDAFPYGYNFRFETAARHIGTTRKMPWLWLDPRCVPMRKGWLREIEEAYFRSKKPFMGRVLTPKDSGTSKPLLTAISVYPATFDKRIFQRLIGKRNVFFETSCAELTVPLAHSTGLIWMQPSTGERAVCKKQDVPQGVVLAHTGAAKMLLADLRGELIPEDPQEEPIEPDAHTNEPPTSRHGYYHSGDLGDIIYAMAAIKTAGGGKLYLGPQQRRTPTASDPIKEPKFRLLEPLLKQQPYLTDVIFSPRFPGTDNAFDLNQFRIHWGDKGLRERTGIKTLVSMHAWTLGVLEKWHPHTTWLTVKDPIVTPYYTVHRSSRYRATENLFPWELIVKRYKGRLLFVGLPQEHADFQKEWNCTVAYWRPRDFLELARVIAGSLGFIGNQSFPNAIALGLGQRVIQEAWEISPDCNLVRPNLLVQPFNERQLSEWEKSPRLSTMKEAPKPAPPVVEVVSQPRRKVSHTPNKDGLIELGPLENASGLGDILTVTPLAEKLGQRAVMCLPESQARFAPLFDGLCQTRITNDHPEFPNPGQQRFIESKLRMFGFQCDDGKTLPVIKLTNDEIAAATRVLVTKGRARPRCIFHTSCAERWIHLRSRPTEFWVPIVEALASNFRLFTDNSLTLRELAASYHVIGRYFGVNTGNWHIAQAVGCKCLVIDADDSDGYNPNLWRYQVPSVEYCGFDRQNILDKTNWLL